MKITEYSQMKIIEENTGDQIRSFRKKLKMTQQELADLLWVTKLTVVRWENGSRNCKGSSLRLINLINEFDLWDKI